MATTVSTVFRNKLSGGVRTLTRAPAQLFQTLSKLSTQANAQIQPDQELSRIEIDPLQHPDYFQVNKLFTVQDLFEAKVHYGHKEGSLNDLMKPFIFGSRLGHTIFDLDQTAELLRQALNFTAHVAYNRGIILFFCRSPQNMHLVEKTALECGEYSHTRRWRLGTFTNSTKEFGAVTRLPDLCIFLNTLNDVMLEHNAVTSSAKMCIPTVGVVDSNCNPNLVTYPIPGNDDTPCAVKLYCKLFKEAILLGKKALTKDDPK